jgi:hypothetical protein
MRRLRPLTEVECYIRCYAAGESSVRVVRRLPRAPVTSDRTSGERLRRSFEARLDAREPEAA